MEEITEDGAGLGFIDPEKLNARLSEYSITWLAALGDEKTIMNKIFREPEFTAKDVDGNFLHG